jgi:hypoxia up-regulated 1
MNSADSTSGETPEKEKQTTDSDGSAEEKINPDGSADEKANPEPEVHDEL